MVKEAVDKSHVNPEQLHDVNSRSKIMNGRVRALRKI